MKKNILKTVIIVYVLLGTFISSFAWNGEPSFQSTSRETIARIAGEMMDFSWTPKNRITNYTLVNPSYYIFTPGTIYHGVAYTQNNPQQNWAEFYNSVNSTPGGSTYFGNDCSGFVSMSWKLPTRYTTSQFESDAASSGGYVTKLGEIGKGNIVTLLRGDALNRSGNHVVLFDYYVSGGIVTMEQTPGPRTNYTDNKNNEMRKYRDWAFLASYRPIRRNNIDEGNYEFKTKWGSQGTANGKFNYPTGVAVDSSANVYVVDSDNHRIQKFNSNGNYLTQWGSGYVSSCAAGKFFYPSGIAVDSTGVVYVPDAGCNLQKFTSTGSFITWWDSSPFSPYGVAIDSSGYVFGADYNEILKLTSNGSLIIKWGSYGSGNGQFKDIENIAVDSFGNVYVADHDNHRIQKFTSNGVFLTKWGACCSPDGYFNYPTGIAIDLSGNVYVADSLNFRIQKFDSNGNFIAKWGAYSTWEDGKFQYPFGIAVDSTLNVYVADWGNHRIQKFSPVSQLPSSPSNLTVTAASSTQNNLSWQDNSNNETGFKIKRKVGINGTYSTIATLGANVTSFSNTGLTPGVTYYYAVWAHNNYGDSAYSNEAVAKAPPKPLVKANGSENNISIPSSTQLNITISLNPGGYLNTNADWWVIGIIKGTTNIWYYYNSLKQWTTTPSPYYQGPLYNLSSLNVFSGILSPGNYDYHFGVDFSVNGVLDANPLFYDSISVTVY